MSSVCVLACSSSASSFPSTTTASTKILSPSSQLACSHHSVPSLALPRPPPEHAPIHHPQPQSKLHKRGGRFAPLRYMYVCTVDVLVLLGSSRLKKQSGTGHTRNAHTCVPSTTNAIPADRQNACCLHALLMHFYAIGTRHSSALFFFHCRPVRPDQTRVALDL